LFFICKTTNKSTSRDDCFCFAKPPTKVLGMIVVLILQENPSDKDLNQGTLVIFNLDPSVSNEEVRQIFGAYGEVKEVRMPLKVLFPFILLPIFFLYSSQWCSGFCLQIRETPNKKHHKFIEFYDVRAAEAALRSLNKSEIAGKRIKLEPSRPGGTRRKYDLSYFSICLYVSSVIAHVSE
jgi:RNA recognition motif-containing protein